jgi:hypothetical protein
MPLAGRLVERWPFYAEGIQANRVGYWFLRKELTSGDLPEMSYAE